MWKWGELKAQLRLWRTGIQSFTWGANKNSALARGPGTMWQKWACLQERTSKSKAQVGHWHKGRVFLRQELVEEHQAVNSLWSMSCDVPPKSIGECSGKHSGGYEQMWRKTLGEKECRMSAVDVKHFILNSWSKREISFEEINLQYEIF